jgi:hypothetical protein
MKRIFTPLVSSLLILGSLNAQVVIWGGSDDPITSFSEESYITTDGVLANDNGYWLTYGISSHVPDSAANAIWMWSEDGRADMGVLFGAREAMASTSGGGAAVFDSDYLDNGGLLDCTNGCDPLTAAMGPAPAFDGMSFNGLGHSGALESPIIDCSMNTTVALSFNNYYRQFNSQQFVDVSNDGGFNWNAIEINTEEASNDPDGVVLLDISEFAANQANVKFRFRWTGSYYFWIIDDVILTEIPKNNLAFPLDIGYFPRNATQPVCQIDTDTFRFGAPVTNLGSSDQFDVTYKISIYNDDTGEMLYTDSTMIGQLPIGATDSLMIIPEPYYPIGLQPALYRIDNEVFSQGTQDFNPADNIVQHFFSVSQGTWGAEIFGDDNIGLWNGGLAGNILCWKRGNFGWINWRR